jgi:hypothetical protein
MGKEEGGMGKEEGGRANKIFIRCKYTHINGKQGQMEGRAKKGGEEPEGE